MTTLDWLIAADLAGIALALVAVFVIARRIGRRNANALAAGLRFLAAQEQRFAEHLARRNSKLEKSHADANR